MSAMGTGEYFDCVEPGLRLAETNPLYGVRPCTRNKPRGEPVTLGEILRIPGVLDYEIGQWGHLELIYDETLSQKEMHLRWMIFCSCGITKVHEYIKREGTNVTESNTSPSH